MVHTTATAGKVVAAAQRDLGKPGPINTCVSNGMQRFASEAGAPKLTYKGRPTASITEARIAGKAGNDGWQYHSGLGGVKPSDFVDWRKPAGIFHVSTVIEVRKSGLGVVLALRTIGSGGPTGKINWQPAAGSPAGWNDASYWQGYWRAPYAAPIKTVAKPAPKPAPTPTASTTKVLRNEGGIAVAARVKIPYPTLQKLNPGVNMNHLDVGQTLRIR